MQRYMATSSGALLRASSRNASSSLSGTYRQMSASVKATQEEGSNQKDAPASEPSTQMKRQSVSQNEIHKNPRIERRLHPVLVRQREGFKQSDYVDLQEPSADRAVTQPTQRQSRSSQAFKTPPKRVDLYLNETGYPQAKAAVPGHESEELHSRRREHLAPYPPDETRDALSGFVDASAAHSKVSRPPPRHKSPSHASHGPHPFRDRQRNFDASRPGPNGANGGGEFGGLRRVPGLRDRQNRFRAQGGPGGNRGGPGGNRPGQFGNRRPGGRPGGIRRQNESKTASVPVKQFAPAPKTVVAESGAYIHAAKLPTRGTKPRILMNVHRAQWKIARRDIEKSLMKDGKAADVLKGDWESYVAPVFKQQATLEDKKSAHGVPVDAKKEALTRATRALAINQAIKLQGKLKVAEKIGSML